MNFALILKLIGSILRIEAFLMTIPLTVSYIYGSNDKAAFLLSICITVAPGFILSFIKPANKRFRAKDAFAATALIWLIFSLFGALPYYFSGYFNSFVDCVFESISGFTTTGATILTDVEALPKGIAFWRCFSQWLGGVGVLVFILAIMPTMNASSANLFIAEISGPTTGRIVPKTHETAKVIFTIYIMMTFVLFLALYFAGLPIYDSIAHALSTAGTGGFSVMNGSIGAYNSLEAEMTIMIFMFLFGISFTLYYNIYVYKFKSVFKNEELRLYLGIIIAAVIIITANIARVYGSLPAALRESAFQVSSMLSTTGFTTTDYNLWPTLSRFILIILMLMGSCAGSTGGGIKLIRILILFKAFRVEINKMLHPKSVKIVTINGKRCDDSVVTKVVLFFFVYFLIFVIAVILVASRGRDMITSITSVIATLSNVGPGFGLIGPIENYSAFKNTSKIVLSFCMIAGRLELFPMLILFAPSVWWGRDGM